MEYIYKIGENLLDEKTCIRVPILGTDGNVLLTYAQLLCITVYLFVLKYRFHLFDHFGKSAN